jgi:hypothetical protein
MKTKEEVDYVRVLEKIFEIFTDWRLEIIVVDFEQAIANAFVKIHPSIIVFKCLFHFGQLIYKNLQSRGFQQLYNNNIRFRNDIRKILSLAFLKTELVETGHYIAKSEIKRYVYNSEDLDDFFNFFVKNYLKKKRILKWNAIYRLKNKIPLTTNVYEGFHNGLNRCFNYAHPSLIHSLCELRKNNQLVHLKNIENSAGLKFNEDSYYTDAYKNIMKKIESFEIYNDVFSYLFAISVDYDWKLN